MRLKSFDNYLIASMSMLALMSLYMLYGVKFISQNAGNQIRVASIVEQIKTVKRKRDFYQSWVDVNPGDGLSQDDEIYTHGQSSAKIVFQNGPVINLFENSLLRIKGLDKKNTLSLDKGNLTATLSKNSPKLDVILNGKKYSFESENANIQIEQGATENKFLLLDGKAKLAIDEASQVISKNQVLIQNKKTGDLKIKELPFVMKSPLHNTVIYYSQEADIPFSWSYSGLSAPAKLLVSTNSNFSDNHFEVEETLNDDHFSHLFTKAGIYYWKLLSLDDVAGPIRTFTLIEEVALPLSLDKEIIYKGPKTLAKALLNWPSDHAKKFLLKIEKPDGLITDVKLNKNSYELSPDQIGLYKISLKVDELHRPKAIWSQAVSLQVLEAKSISITGLTPELLEKVNYSSEPTTMLLAWSGPTSGVNYTVKLTHDKKSESFQTENTSLPLSLKTAGEYTWEVSGETESGILSNAISGKIIIKAPLHLSQTPSEGAVIELEKPDQLVSFKWDSIENNRDYQFELASDPAFSTILYEKDVSTNSIATAVAKTGRYFWRVKIKKGNAIEYSTPVSVEIKPTPPLGTPADLPSIKIQLKYLEDKSSSIIFHLIDLFMPKAEAADAVAYAEWDLPANSRAREYIVEIYQDSALSKLVTRMTFETPHVVWKNATPGVFYWRVSYVDFWGRKTEFSKASTLSTEPDPEVLKAEAKKLAASIPIELLTPKHREDILARSEDDFLFSWASIPETKNYQFLVSNDLEFESLIINSKVSGEDIKIKCHDFQMKEGDYYWKVNTAAGNTSKRRMFHVTCAPKKIEPPIVVPEVAKAPPVTEPLKKDLGPRHYAKLGFFPHKLTYTNKSANYSAKVDGNALNSIYGLYSKPVDWKYFQQFTPSLWVSRGKVFKTITFTDFELNLKAAKRQTDFSWGPVVSLVKKTLYVESNLAIIAAGQSSPLLGVFIQKEFDRMSVNAEIKMGGMTDLHFDMQYALKNRISIGAFFDSTTLSKEESKHSFSRMGLNLNYIFPFLENEK